MYKPPLVSYNRLSYVERILATFSVQFDYTILLGDLNINLFEQANDRMYLEQILNSFKLKQVIAEPTRLTRTSSSLIDVICLDDKLKVTETGTMGMYNQTDHRLTYCKVEFNTPKHVTRSITYRDFRNFNKDQFNTDMEQIDFVSLLQYESTGTRVCAFNDQLREIFDIHAPYRTVQLKHSYKPYITFTIKEIIKLKDKAFKEYNRTKNTQHKLFYLDLKNYLSFAIRSEKKAYMNFEINKINNDSKRLWRRLDQWDIHSKSSYNIPPFLKDVNEISKFFSNISHLSMTIEPATLERYRNTKFSENSCFNFKKVTDDDIYKAFRQLKSKCSGIDQISFAMLEWSMTYIIDFLKNLINDCLEFGDFPTVWKTALVKPIPKVSNPISFSDLRAINILPILSKLVERLVFTMLIEYISSENILPSVQSGFRANHSTATALSKVTTDIVSGMDKSEAACLVLLDYSRAFDLLNHELLIAKLHYYGISENACLWFLNYLSGRIQIVEIDGVRSAPSNINYGVPQGTILGPVLFSLYTSDLPQSVLHCSVHLYADDTQLVRTFEPSQASRDLQKVNTDLDRILNWSKSHGLSLNTKKSCYLIIGTNSVKNKVQMYNFTTVNICGEIIPQNEFARNLGVTFDTNLNFENHVSKKLGILYMKLKTMYKFKFLLSEKIKFMLIESLLYPQIDYGLTVYYSFLTLEFKNKLQLAQNSCIRFVYCVSKFDHITPIYEVNSHLKIESRFMLLFGVFLFKIFKNKQPEYMWNYIVPRQELHNLNLRNLVRFDIPHHVTKKFECCFAYLAVKLLNSDSYFNLMEGKSLITFRIAYKKYLLELQNGMT